MGGESGKSAEALNLAGGRPGGKAERSVKSPSYCRPRDLISIFFASLLPRAGAWPEYHRQGLGDRGRSSLV